MAGVILNNKLLRESNGGVTLLQSYYVENILCCFGYSDYRLTSTPYNCHDLKDCKGSIVIFLNHWHTNYLDSATSPDISFVVSKLNMFVSNPGDDH